MTQHFRAPASRSLRQAPIRSHATRRGPALWAGFLIGGGLLGCAAFGFSLSGPHVSQAWLAPALPTPSQAERPSAYRMPAHRVVSAPDERRFGGAGEDAKASAAGADLWSQESGAGRVAAVPTVFSRTDQERAAKAHPVRAAVPSHRFDPAVSGAWAAFVPVTVPKTSETSLVAQAPAPQPDRRVAAALSKPAHDAPKPPSVEVKLASLEPAHVEVALPDLPPEVLDRPTSAKDALERELALAVPMPTARPFRRMPAAEPDLRHRSRAPAGLLAYARPDAGALGDEPDAVPERAVPISPSLRAGTAVYDISAATVYLPNGERLEAHSGLGSLRDNVRYVHVKNRGATPPHTYNLTMRESLFHGVAAIRLTPIGGERKIHNRNGLLAHTYMLGPRGDSNGCVSFKDYKRFLAAYKRGEIRRLVVVPSYRNPTSRVASLFGMGKR